MRQVTFTLKCEAPKQVNMAFLMEILITFIHIFQKDVEVVEYGVDGDIDNEEHDEAFEMAIKAGFITDVHKLTFSGSELVGSENLV